MTEILKMAHERIFSAEIFGEGMARKLDGLWLAQQLGAHDDYAPHRVQTQVLAVIPVMVDLLPEY